MRLPSPAQFDDAILEMARLTRELDSYTLHRARTGQLAGAASVYPPAYRRPLLTALAPHGMATVVKPGASLG